jgi:hypothetical protein
MEHAVVSIYRQAFVCFGHSWWYFLAIAMLLEIAPAVSSSKLNEWTLSLILTFFFAYAIHRHFLLGEELTWKGRDKRLRPQTTGRFLLVSFFMLLVPMAFAFWTVISMRSGIDDDESRQRLASGIVALGIVIYWIMLAVFGTALPAAAVGDRFGIGLTLHRARATFLRVLFQLFAGPTLFTILLVVTRLLIERVTGVEFGLYDATEKFSAAGFVFGSAYGTTGLISTTLAVAVLCNAYRRVEPNYPGEPS